MQDHKTVDHSDKGKRKLVEEVRTLRSRLSKLERGNIIGTQGVGRDITDRKKAEDMLRESEQRYRTIFKQAADSIVLVDADTGELVEFNDKAHEILGYSREEFQKLRIPDFEIIESAEEVAKHIEKIVRKGADTFETKHRTKDGQIRDIMVSSRAISIGGKNFCQSIWRDITEHMRAENALQEAEAEKMLILSSVSELVSYQDSNLRVKWANRAAAESVTQTVDDLIGRHCYEIWHQRDELCVDCPVKRSIDTGQSQEGEVSTPDGRIWSIRGNPVRNKDGEIIGAVEVTMDITERKESEEALRESGQRYRSLFEQSPLGIGLATADGEILRANKAMEVITGYSEEELKKIDLTDLYENPQDRKKLLKTISQYGSAVDFATRLKRRDGTVYDALLNVSRVRLDGEDLLQTICIDVTERKKAVEALRGSEQRYRAIFEQAADSIVLIDAETGELVEFNDKAHENLGYSREEFQKLRIPDFEVIESAEEVAKRIEKIVREGADAFGTKHRTKDGQIRDILVSSRAISIGGKNFCQGIWRDITERKKAQDELRQFKTISDGAGYGAAIIDVEASLIYVNESFAKMHGYRPEELIGKHVSIFHTKEQMPNVERLIKQLMREGNYVDAEVWHKRKDGTVFLSSMTGTCIMDEKGKPLFMAATAIDITERKEAEKTLITYQNDLRSLASKLTSTEEHQRRQIAADLHDNVSQALALSVNQLRRLRKSAALADAKTLDEVCQTIGKAIQNVQDLTFDLASPTLYKIGLEAAISELLSEQLRDRHGIICEFSDDKKAKPLDEDVRVLVFQAVRELLVNVIKHSEAHKVEVAVKRKKDNIQICVNDDGVGFDTEKAKASIQRGGGFGLFNIRERLDYIGGTFEMHSQPGSGSRFILTAPIKA